MNCAKLRAVKNEVIHYLPGWAGVCLMVFAAVAAMSWAIAAGLGPGSFALGCAVGAATVCLMWWVEDAERWRALAGDRESKRMEEDSEFRRWVTKRTRLECRRLRRELRETDWMGGGGRES